MNDRSHPLFNENLFRPVFEMTNGHCLAGLSVANIALQGSTPTQVAVAVSCALLGMGVEEVVTAVELRARQLGRRLRNSAPYGAHRGRPHPKDQTKDPRQLMRCHCGPRASLIRSGRRSCMSARKRLRVRRIITISSYCISATWLAINSHRHYTLRFTIRFTIL